MNHHLMKMSQATLALRTLILDLDYALQRADAASFAEAIFDPSFDVAYYKRMRSEETASFRLQQIHRFAADAADGLYTGAPLDPCLLSDVQQALQQLRDLNASDDPLLFKALIRRLRTRRHAAETAKARQEKEARND